MKEIVSESRRRLIKKMKENGGDQRNLEPWNRLEGKVVMVTGASSGLGREFCLNLAKAGCKILAVARRKDRLKSLCDEINQMKPNISNDSASSASSSEDSKSKACAEIRAVAVELDVCAAGPAIDASVQIAWDVFGRIDALINSAGVRGTVSPSIDLSEEEWNNTLRTDLTGSWLVTKSVCRRIHENGLRGSVMFISSISGIQRGELPGGIAYGAAKAGLNAMTKIMAIELGPLKIRVNSIAPGLFKSEITEGLMQKDWLDTVALKTVPLGQFGTIDPALTSLVRFLIHESSSYVSGNVFIVDSGNTLPGFPIFSSL
ncbi:3-oxoacyl-[acyl-carrier-protein] reductase FabG-like [Macadamia integrifolia]|uniref:3-oxoacyl-[acyl-carrier-protein] reductase FabG-like n=1 Tax=Macadamia integrifolia TaxID=60698 RepID=UPI001C4E6C0C|nr:3-oxoacyl-[acyl-carrier-protein] reductase FabG-like [Macadamia integrifolia]